MRPRRPCIVGDLHYRGHPEECLGEHRKLGIPAFLGIRSHPLNEPPGEGKDRVIELYSEQRFYQRLRNGIWRVADNLVKSKSAFFDNLQRISPDNPNVLEIGEPLLQDWLEPLVYLYGDYPLGPLGQQPREVASPCPYLEDRIRLSYLRQVDDPFQRPIITHEYLVNPDVLGENRAQTHTTN